MLVVNDHLLKALAGQLTADNREACAQTTKPLVEAVEALTTFASSPEFASTPAKISPQVECSNHDYCDIILLLIGSQGSGANHILREGCHQS